MLITMLMVSVNPWSETVPSPLMLQSPESSVSHLVPLKSDALHLVVDLVVVRPVGDREAEARPVAVDLVQQLLQEIELGWAETDPGLCGQETRRQARRYERI